MIVCPEPKTSQVMMKWCRRASHLGRFTLWHNGRWAAQLGRFTLCDTTAAELHDLVALLCGTMAAELLHNSVDLLCVAQQPPSYRLDRFTRYTLWHDGRQATTQLDRFTLCGTTASELHNSVDLLCGTTATKLHISVDLLCGTIAAELHNLVDLLCTTATELNNPLSLTHAPGVTHIFQRQWQTVLKNMKA